MTKTYSIQVTLDFNVEVEADSLGEAYNKAQDEAIIDDCFDFVMMDVTSPEIEMQAAVDMGETQRARDIKEHDRNMENASPAVREGFALANKLAAKMDDICNPPIISGPKHQDYAERIICGNKALSSPGKRIKSTSGYWYSPNGTSVYSIRQFAGSKYKWAACEYTKKGFTQITEGYTLREVIARLSNK